MRAALLLLALGACVDKLPPITGTTSLEVTVNSPASTGSVMNRLPDTARNVTVSLQAKDADGNNDATYTKTVQVYVHFLGTLTPYLTGMPLKTINVTNGVASNVQIMLPAVFGPTTIWFDDGQSTDATYATGVSDTLWYRDPFIADIQTPPDETVAAAFDASPLETKNVSVDSSRHAGGHLVVTSVFAQGYTVADVMCADAAGTPPCTAGDYDSVEVFSFSAPADQRLRFIKVGQFIDGFAGGISEFNGLTEIGFPQTFVAAEEPDVNEARIPAPVVIDQSWFSTNKINFERNEAGAIEIDGGKVCPLDDDYTTYKQWKIDPAGVADAAACSGKNLVNVITTGVLEIDPATLVGKVVPKIVGILRPVNIGTFNVWIIYPRSMADLTAS